MDIITGWAALTAVSIREVYAGVTEVCIYSCCSPQTKKGSALWAALITASEAAGIWTFQAGILPENTASLKLHEAHGFRLVAYREKIGIMKGA